MPDPSAHDQCMWRQEVMPRMQVLTELNQPTLAAASLLPDCEASPRESFILFENVRGPKAKRGPFKFEPSIFPNCIVGRWLTLDAGDRDGDGDDDIALGSLIRMPVKVPEFLKDNWEKTGTSV